MLGGMSEPQQPTPFEPEQPQQPAPRPYAAQPPHPPAGAAGSLGRIAFIIAVVGAGLGIVAQLLAPALIPTGMYWGYEILTGIRSILGVFLAVAAVILGFLAARRGTQPVLAGAAMGIGALEFLGTTSAYSATLMYPLFY